MMLRNRPRIEQLGGNDSVGHVFDLSTSGVAFLSDYPVQDNAKVQIKLNELTLDGTVMHVEERTDGIRLGVQFDAGSIPVEDVQELVDRYSRGVPVTCTITEIYRT